MGDKSMSKRASGYVKWYHLSKHFGFLIKSDENREVFFHIDDFDEGLTPQINQPVEFDLGFDRQGRAKALNVKAVTVGVKHEHDDK